MDLKFLLFILFTFWLPSYQLDCYKYNIKLNKNEVVSGFDTCLQLFSVHTTKGIVNAANRKRTIEGCKREILDVQGEKVEMFRCTCYEDLCNEQISYQQFLDNGYTMF
uniref:Activin_recp domain-containing protein n=1 Tax=Caenorhabditis tropicalis TaxID=1561998 RepID=A0A1I7TRJ6_9PELO